MVLFVQIVPKLQKNRSEAQGTVSAVAQAQSAAGKGGKGSFGFVSFFLAALIGILVGSFKIKAFSLTITGGCLIVGLLFGAAGHVGRIDLTPSSSMLNLLRELGLVLFLAGAGVSGGASFYKYFQPIYFLYGALMTTLPMLIGYVAAKKVVRLELFDNLGSITGGMTSTPALGVLIRASGSNDVASSYAATYPIALFLVVVTAQIIMQFL